MLPLNMLTNLNMIANKIRTQANLINLQALYCSRPTHTLLSFLCRTCRRIPATRVTVCFGPPALICDVDHDNR